MAPGPPWAGNVQFMVLPPACAFSSARFFGASSSWRGYLYRSVRHLKDSHSDQKRKGWRESMGPGGVGEEEREIGVFPRSDGQADP